MNSDTINDFSNFSSSGISIRNSTNNSGDYTNKKRRRNSSLKNFSSKEEERILKYALKLSEKEFHSQNDTENKKYEFKKYLDLPESTVFYATEEDFQNPISYFDKLWQENEDNTGLIKIVPPTSWKQIQREYYEDEIRVRVNSNDKPLNTRKQTLGLLYQAKKFDHVRELNYEQYKSFANKIFSENFENRISNDIKIEVIEEKYWELCHQNEENVMIHYAADISMQRYYTKSEILEKLGNSDLTDCNQSKSSLGNVENSNIDFQKNKEANEKKFSLLRANIFKNSLMQFIKTDKQKQISGITIPWYYFGMLFSSFCWHTEDLYLYSLNYLHDGSPKIWYGISTKDKEKMDDYIKNKYYAILLKQPDLIHRLTVHIDPMELKANGINVFRVVQNPGEIILTLPKAYHSGFSTGLNMGEAVNLSTIKWIDYGFEAQRHYKIANRKVPVFSMEWLLMQNYENSNISKFEDKNYKNKIKAYINQIITTEIENRSMIENFFEINQINYIVEELVCDDDTEIFDCNFCTHLAFLSQLICKNCKKKSCLSHNIQCKW